LTNHQKSWLSITLVSLTVSVRRSYWGWIEGWQGRYHTSCNSTGYSDYPIGTH